MPWEVNITHSSLETIALLTEELLDFVVTSILVSKMEQEMLLSSETNGTAQCEWTAKPPEPPKQSSYISIIEQVILIYYDIIISNEY